MLNCQRIAADLAPPGTNWAAPSRYVTFWGCPVGLAALDDVRRHADMPAWRQ
jgi:hypothetical protein